MARTIEIAGGGIAGLTAAINLRRAGRRVRVFEKRDEIGARFDGDFQAIENWSTKEDALDFLRRLHIQTNFPFKASSAATAYDAFGKRYHYEYEDVVGYMVRRGPEENCLDQHLKSQALDLGVEIVLGGELDPAQADIIATGPGRPLVLLHGVAFRTNVKDMVQIIYDDRLAPRFYSYMIVNDGRGIICSARLRSEKGGIKNLDATTARFRELIDFEMSELRPFGNCGVCRPIFNHRKIIVGEAAGLQDQLWGFGMRCAFLSGYLAAKAIVERKDYWAMVRREIGPYVHISTVNRLLADVTRDFGYWALLNAMRCYRRLRHFLYYHYTPRLWKLCLYPLAAAHVRAEFSARPKPVAAEHRRRRAIDGTKVSCYCIRDSGPTYGRFSE